MRDMKQGMRDRGHLHPATCLLSLVSCLGLFLSPVPCPVSHAFAEEAPRPLKIGVVDLEQVFQEYDRTASKEQEIKGLAESKKSERDRMVSQIQGLRDEMVLLNEEGRQGLREKFEERLKGLSEFDKEAQTKLGQQRNEAFRLILGEIEEVIGLYSKENGFDLVLTERAALFRAQTIDITQDIIRLLDQRYAKAAR